MPRRWIGDLSTCFLLDDGWAFRLKVNSFQLKGKPGWQMPVSVAEALGLESGQLIELTCATQSIGHTLWIERRHGSCVGGEIDVPLRRLGCKVDELAFFVFRHDSYTVVPRFRHELDPEDPLGSLLWHSGLDPTSEALRADPWRRLARAMGGTGGTPDAVAERLHRRGDRRLLPLLEEAASQRRAAASFSNWTPHWQYTLPDQDDEERFILQRPDGCVRVALGVMDGTAQPPRELTLGAGSTLWTTLTPSDDLDSVDELLQAPPSGLIPAAASRSWVRWMRAEHAGRRAALLGAEWRIERHRGEWRRGGRPFADLPGALLALRDDTSSTSAIPSDQARSPYPRNGLAFNALLEAADRRGFEELQSAGERGYCAQFAEGRRAYGVALVDALEPD